MAENRNIEISDEMMAKATGGELDPWNETVVISGIVMVNPRPDDPAYASVWDDCQSSGYQVYEGGGRLLVAGSHLPSLTPGDEVYVNQIRGFYGWEIEGVIDY